MQEPALLRALPGYLCPFWTVASTAPMQSPPWSGHRQDEKSPCRRPPLPRPGAGPASRRLIHRGRTNGAACTRGVQAALGLPPCLRGGLALLRAAGQGRLLTVSAGVRRLLAADGADGPGLCALLAAVDLAQTARGVVAVAAENCGVAAAGLRHAAGRACGVAAARSPGLRCSLRADSRGHHARQQKGQEAGPGDLSEHRSSPFRPKGVPVRAGSERAGDAHADHWRLPGTRVPGNLQ